MMNEGYTIFGCGRERVAQNSLLYEYQSVPPDVASYASVQKTISKQLFTVCHPAVSHSILPMSPLPDGLG